MKRIIALALAVVMVMSMVCVVGAEEFTDADQIDKMNTEAVTVLSEMGIIAGMGDGTFGPQKTLTRAQAAKIICYMLLGKDKAEALAPADKFSDVPASHWSNKYVAYCAEQGIVAGIGSGKFGPNNNLTGLAFGKMLLCGVAGFNAEAEGLTGSSWDKNTNKLLKSENLNLGVEVTSKDMTRENACHLALNFLFDGEAEDPEGTLAYEVFGATRTFGKTDKKNNFGRPTVIYTTEESDLCWEGTDLELNASPFVVFPGQFTVDKVYKAVGNQEFDVEHMTGVRNGTDFNRSTFDTPVVEGSTSRFNCSGYGVLSEFFLDAVNSMLYYVNIATRCYKITDVTEASFAADGSVLEPGTVTVEGDKTCECNEFTKDDIGSYALCHMNGKGSWKDSETLIDARKPVIKTGTLNAEDGVKVDGKTYQVLYSTMSANQGSIDPTAKEYIANGGSVGDQVSIVLDENNICYGIFN